MDAAPSVAGRRRSDSNDDHQHRAVVIDVDDRLIRVGSHHARLGRFRPERSVVPTYVDLVSQARGVTPGTFPVRSADMLSIAAALDFPLGMLGGQLRRAMHRAAHVDRLPTPLARYALPASGLVAAGAAGVAAYFALDGSRSAPAASGSTPTTAVDPLTTELGVPAGPASSLIVAPQDHAGHDHGAHDDGAASGTGSPADTTSQIPGPLTTPPAVVDTSIAPSATTPSTSAPPTTASTVPPTTVPPTTVPLATPQTTAAPTTAAPVLTVPVTEVPVTVASPDTVVPIEHHEAIGQQALAMITYDYQSNLPQWTIDFRPGKQGLLGYAFFDSKRIEVYVRDHHTVAEVAATLAHELGHAVDVSLLTDAERVQWAAVRGFTDDWWPGAHGSDYGSGAGDWAEAFATWQVGEISRSTVAGQPTSEQLVLLAQIVG